MSIWNTKKTWIWFLPNCGDCSQGNIDYRLSGISDGCSPRRDELRASAVKSFCLSHFHKCARGYLPSVIENNPTTALFLRIMSMSDNPLQTIQAQFQDEGRVSSPAPLLLNRRETETTEEMHRGVAGRWDRRSQRNAKKLELDIISIRPK